MVRGILVAGLILTGLATVAWAGPAEERGLAIMEEQERINKGFRDEAGRYKMTLINSNGDRSERLLQFKTLEGEKDAGDKTLIVFLAPPDVKSTALLTHTAKKGDDDQWLYLPALRRVKKIASSTKSSSFVGSEFTYEDLTPRELDKYAWKHLRDETVDGVAVWVVESVPQFKDSGYSKMELFIQQDNHQTIRTNFYDKKGELIKVGRFQGWSKVGGQWWRTKVSTMENVQTKKSTVLETLETRFGNRFSARDFTTQVLEKQ